MTGASTHFTVPNIPLNRTNGQRAGSQLIQVDQRFQAANHLEVRPHPQCQQRLLSRHRLAALLMRERRPRLGQTVPFPQACALFMPDERLGGCFWSGVRSADRGHNGWGQWRDVGEHCAGFAQALDERAA